jgi:hypothetical protein
MLFSLRYLRFFTPSVSSDERFARVFRNIVTANVRHGVLVPLLPIVLPKFAETGSDDIV